MASQQPCDCVGGFDGMIGAPLPSSSVWPGCRAGELFVTNSAAEDVLALERAACLVSCRCRIGKAFDCWGRETPDRVGFYIVLPLHTGAYPETTRQMTIRNFWSAYDFIKSAKPAEQPSLPVRHRRRISTAVILED